MPTPAAPRTTVSYWDDHSAWLRDARINGDRDGIIDDVPTLSPGVFHDAARAFFRAKQAFTLLAYTLDELAQDARQSLPDCDVRANVHPKSLYRELADLRWTAEQLRDMPGEEDIREWWAEMEGHFDTLAGLTGQSLTLARMDAVRDIQRGTQRAQTATETAR